jgi:2-dehydro-3-deoxygluconokinase
MLAAVLKDVNRIVLEDVPKPEPGPTQVVVKVKACGNRALAPYVDVMIGNEEDFSAALGFEVQGVDADLSSLDPTSFKRMILEVVKTFPNLKVVTTTLRHAKTAGVNDWGAVARAGGEFFDADFRPNLEIHDRVGGGDGFASGLIYGLMEGKSVQEAVNYGAAHGALAMTTPGDMSTASLKEVERVMKGGTARVQR